MNYEDFSKIEMQTVFFNKLIYREDAFRLLLTIALLYHLQNKTTSIEQFESEIENQFKCITNILSRQIHEAYKLKDRYQRKKFKIEKVLKPDNNL